ncbi:hypothetical protein PoB_002545400 [Plakobranchus ocellatus]|uniref:Uncharacterized protein n=1 Tax=Plakobranchus ocellatus TaxID=259542 RepID=A0AAV3ZYE5_9GAST|nr:hypothetical protein PoB_002545400 [Plakobranchus ocellatus]
MASRVASNVSRPLFWITLLYFPGWWMPPLLFEVMCRKTGLLLTAWLAGAWSPAYCMARRSLVSRLLHGLPEPGLSPTAWLAGARSLAYCMARQSLVCRLLTGSPECCKGTIKEICYRFRPRPCVSGTVGNETALRSAGRTFLLPVQVRTSDLCLGLMRARKPKITILWTALRTKSIHCLLRICLCVYSFLREISGFQVMGSG